MLNREAAHEEGALPAVGIVQLHRQRALSKVVDGGAQFAVEVGALALQRRRAPGKRTDAAKVRIDVGWQLVRVVEPLDDAQNGAFDGLAVALEERKPQVGTVARAVQIDALGAEGLAQIVHVVRAFDGVVGVPVHAAFAPRRGQLARVGALGGEVGVAGGRRVRGQLEARRIVETRQCPVAASLIEGHDVADFGKALHPREEVRPEGADAGCAGPAEEHDQRRKAMVALRQTAHEGQGDGGARVVFAARRHQQQAAFGGERPAAVAVPQAAWPRPCQVPLPGAHLPHVLQGKRHQIAGGLPRRSASGGPIRPMWLPSGSATMA